MARWFFSRFALTFVACGPPVRCAVASRLLLILLLGLLLSGCASKLSQTRFGVSQNDAQELAWDAGRKLYVSDRAARISSDALEAHGKGDFDPLVRGWLVLPGAKRVAFYGLTGGTPRPLYFVDVDDDGKARIAVASSDAAFSPEEKVAISARETAKSAITTHCGAGWNTVVLPASVWRQEGWLVYFLVPQPDPRVVPTAGHTRVHVSKDGKTVLGKLELSPGCGTIPAPAPGDMLGIMTPHSDIVLEHFVFVALTYNVNLYVSARGRALSIPGGE